MRRIKRVFFESLVFLSVAGFTASCASIPELQIDYRLPPRSDRLRDKKVVLKIVDARKNKGILNPGARKKLEGFSGNFSLSVAGYKGKGVTIGIFQVKSMIREVLKRRLENLGLTVLFNKSHGVPQLLFVLKEFFLDLEGERWVAKMSYEARLLRDGGFMASQELNGQAERYELVGREEADVAVGEIFTDLVNRLDVAGLFQKVGL
ncbi:MAG: hypothetical protein ISS61_14995 [Desulfobacteraceae bacterium]|nr:hypothetical protein [Desulfobacteraceae bacterium]